MSSLTNYSEPKVADNLLGDASITPPSTWYVALFTVMPSAAGGGTEVSGGSYARVAVTNNSTNFPATSGEIKSNGTDITFPTSTAAWGTIVGIGFYDASTGGNLWLFGALTNPPTMASGDGFRIPAGQFTLSF
jgi:hypothetical protein